MKNIQTRFLKIILSCVITFLSIYSHAKTLDSKLAEADSLFKLKRYTQSLVIYEALLSVQQYSPAMLLKMAYIQEGLGKIGKSLYYLNLYYQITGDEQALVKMEEVASKNRLEGYKNIQAEQFYYYVKKYSYVVSVAFAGLALLTLSWMFYRRRSGTKPIVALVILMILLLVLALQVNFPLKNSSVMISENNTYLMKGPSAGAPVIGVVSEGHKLQLLGRKDVWMKVKWNDQAVYVKQNQVISADI